MSTAPTPCAVTSTDTPKVPSWSTSCAIGDTNAMNGAASKELIVMYTMIVRMPGSAKAKAKPSRIDAKIDGNGPGCGPGSTSVDTTITTARKLTVLIANAMP
ncbi:unannotated protein [freshwater metagenome]|uniref:Unannotated protein n=1 Tax=freshwater metagenome TaxID=449393 RepID=A0A6J7AU32_9ZZZZ